MLGYFAQLAFITGEDPPPMGSSHPNIVPYGSFPAADGSIIIAVLSERFWANLCNALERPDLAADSRFASPTLLPRPGATRLDAMIAKITRTKTVAEWERRLQEADVPHSPVLGVTAALSSPHALAREMVVDVEHPTIGAIKVAGRPIKFPGARQPPVTPPPSFGQHHGVCGAAHRARLQRRRDRRVAKGRRYRPDSPARRLSNAQQQFIRACNRL